MTNFEDDLRKALGLGREIDLDCGQSPLGIAREKIRQVQRKPKFTSEHQPTNLHEYFEERCAFFEDEDDDD